jgi:hypothetical protein
MEDRKPSTQSTAATAPATGEPVSPCRIRATTTSATPVTVAIRGRQMLTEPD